MRYFHSRLVSLSLFLVISGTCVTFHQARLLAGTTAEGIAQEGEDAKKDKPSPEEAFEILRAHYEENQNRPLEERALLVEQFAGAPCQKTVEYLKGLYQSEDNSGIHMSITVTLGKIGSADAIKGVILMGLPLLADDAYNVEAVGTALECKLTPEAETWFLKKGLVQALRKYKDLWIRVLGAVSRFKSPQRITVLTNELRRSSLTEVQVAILESIEDVKDPKLASVAKAMIRAPDPDVQVAALSYMFFYDAKRSRLRFVSGLRSKHWQVRVLSLVFLDQLDDKNIIKHATRFLDDREHKVQVNAIRVLLNRGGADAILPLINHLDKAKGRVKDDIADALARLTGKNFGPVGGQWESWWLTYKNNLAGAELKKLSAEAFSELKESDRDQRTLLYHGLRVLSDNVIFIIDTSQSMEEEYVPLEERDDEEGRRKTVVENLPKDPNKESAQAKIEVAKKELRQVLKGLVDGKRCNIIGFDSFVVDFIRDTLSKEPTNLVKIFLPERQQAGAFIDRMRPRGQTYMRRALETAFTYEEVDTIFLLSDGAPTPQSGGPQEILQKLRRLNRLRSVKINTIGFDLKRGEKEFLRQLADEHFGVFIER